MSICMRREIERPFVYPLISLAYVLTIAPICSVANLDSSGHSRSQRGYCVTSSCSRESVATTYYYL